MNTHDDSNNSPDLRPRTGKNLFVSHNQHSRVTIIVWGLRKELTTLEVRAKFVDVGLENWGTYCGRETISG